jgi:hypothetical protein
MGTDFWCVSRPFSARRAGQLDDDRNMAFVDVSASSTVVEILRFCVEKRTSRVLPQLDAITRSRSARARTVGGVGAVMR